MIESAVREAKAQRLYRTRSLLPALEIVRTRQAEFIQDARVAHLDPRVYEGLIVLECGGRIDAIDYMFLRGTGRRAHVGLGQIGWIEGRSAGLRVDPNRERQMQKAIREALGVARAVCMSGRPLTRTSVAGALRREIEIEREWKRSDQRFDPRLNLRASARLLMATIRRYHDPTLGIAAYHAGGGNIDRALRLERLSDGRVARSYWDLYDHTSGPVFALLSSWSDDSRNYLAKVAAASDIVEKYLNAPDRFRTEYLYWGPVDADQQLAEVTGSRFTVAARRSG